MHFTIEPTSRLGRILDKPFRLLPKNTEIRILRGPLKGKHWLVRSARPAFWLGIYEPEMQRVFDKELKLGDVVYDIGANVGYYSLLSSKLVGPYGRVYCFEPDESNVDFLKRHIQMNNAYNCIVQEVAVGRTTGQTYFKVEENCALGHVTDEITNTRVDIVSIDELVNSGMISPPNLIKCDIQGNEYDAMLGASKTISTYRPKILLSTHSDDLFKMCSDFLSNKHYTISTLDDKTDPDKVIIALA